MATTFDDGGYGSGGAQFSFPRMTPAVRVLLWTNIVLGVLFLLLANVSPLAAALHGWLGLDVPRWRELAPFVPLWQLVTYGFVHSTSSPMHLLMNMLGLYFFGTYLEALVGTRRFALFYGIAIVLPAVLQLVFSLVAGQNLFVVGASGGILALVVAMAALRPHMLVIFLFVPLKLWVLASIFVVLDLFGLLSGGSGTAHLVHLGGALFGFSAAKLGWLWFDPVAHWETRRETKRVERAQSDEERLDELLQRIHREGIGSLSSGEREFLKRMSARRGG